MNMKQPEAIRLADQLSGLDPVSSWDSIDAADTLRRQHDLLVQAREWITLNGWHDDECDVFRLDDDDRHLPCSCGLSELIDSVNAELEK